LEERRNTMKKLVLALVAVFAMSNLAFAEEGGMPAAGAEGTPPAEAPKKEKKAKKKKAPKKEKAPAAEEKKEEKKEEAAH
jgi:hypothetical protein